MSFDSLAAGPEKAKIVSLGREKCVFEGSGMSASAHLDAGQVWTAIERLNEEIDVHQGDTHLVIFLSELLCVSGQWDRAEEQLERVVGQSREANDDVLVFRNMVRAERHRRRVFSGVSDPHFVTEPPAYVTLHLDALHKLERGGLDEVKALLDSADGQWCKRPGTMGARSFHSFRDADNLVAPVLELIVQDRYIWMPYEQIQRFEITSPRRLRDLLWVSIRVGGLGGTMLEAFVPVQYAISCEHSTQQRIDHDPYAAVALRQFLIDGEKRAMLDSREVEFEVNHGAKELHCLATEQPNTNFM